MNLLPGWIKLAILAALVAAGTAGIAWFVHSQRDVGRAEVRAEWALEREALKDAALKESEANARETLRRLDRQQENQRVQNQELAAARADADRNRADADRLRTQSADTARQWRDALGNSPTVAVCQAAGAAITVQADVRSRMDGAAGILAEYADAARVAGLKCQRDYSALTPAVAIPAPAVASQPAH